MSAEGKIGLRAPLAKTHAEGERDFAKGRGLK